MSVPADQQIGALDASQHGRREASRAIVADPDHQDLSLLPGKPHCCTAAHRWERLGSAAILAAPGFRAGADRMAALQASVRRIALPTMPPVHEVQMAQ